MPRIQLSASFGKATATFTCEAAENGSVPRPKSFGFGEGVCTCARCMRRAGPIREDVEERIMQIAYVLANVFADTPNPEDLVKDHHRKRAQEFMTAVEEGQVDKLVCYFDALDGGETIQEEIATELIISAAQLGQADVIKLLIEKGADVEEKDLRRGGRPLMHAANNGHTLAVKTLIDCGADTEARDDNGYTALMVAIFSDRSSAAEALLQSGALVDATDEKGRTALCYAAMYGSTDCIYLLANYHANVFHVDKDGNTPLELAEDSGRSSAVEALKKLQMKMKMQERRRHRQKAQGCSANMTDGEMAQREAEAARRAEQLLRELEQEAAKKAAKTSKISKKQQQRKGKGKASDCSSAAGGDDGCPFHPGDDSPHACHDELDHDEGHSPHDEELCRGVMQWGGGPGGRGGPCHGVGRVGHHGWVTKAESPDLQSRRSRNNECRSSLAPEQQPQPPVFATPQQAPQPPAGGVKHWLEELLMSKGGAGGDQRHSDHNSRSEDAAPPPEPEPAERKVDVEALRREWEALLETAAHCLDPGAQPAVLAQVKALLPKCSQAGISVKYGRKVMQRLEAVGPARQALAAALAAPPGGYKCAELEAVLSQCKACRCLLDPDQLRALEDRMEKARKEEEQSKWNSLASALSWDEKASGLPAGHGDSLVRRDGHHSSHHDMGEDHIDAELECVVCLSAVKNACCIPCGHVCMCQDCAQDVHEQRGLCPVCRTPIDCVIEILA